MSRFFSDSKPFSWKGEITDNNLLTEIRGMYRDMTLIELLAEENTLLEIISRSTNNTRRYLFLQNLQAEIGRKLR